MDRLCPIFFAAALVMAAQPGRAQSADIPRHGSSLTGLNDLEPPAPRYMQASVLLQLQTQAPEPTPELPKPVPRKPDRLLLQPEPAQATPPAPPAGRP
ncbi:hypothetical protein SAMN02745146_1767 [Hymenobacter daecheongensis DSM 21074]|uniref:Uncharacterized protein n=1 Tax=Hymenobacter daecheongensis DSM 21074 TaxID=1121955 RepID=A0A1M6EPV9_9BACT|nr:hypothetical protein [Hymenobacter daecheongensis]SHI87389.1 hypothetical protein SAMN02745146_1767 [Hymenobacter daecheongensis DSM 21074]